MCKKPILLLIMCLMSHGFLMAQYTDEAADSVASESDSTTVTTTTWKEKLYPGIEFMVTANTGVFYAELSPFIGYRPLNPIMVGAGIHGSFLGAGNGGNYSYYGGRAFARLIIGDAFFIHGEYNLLNGVINAAGTRQWVGSPIAGIGIQYGGQTYLLIGYATNSEFQQVNPLGGLIYRLGVYF